MALNKISFNVPRGSITGFVGPNGAGKTTSLRIICTLIRPDQGQAHVLGYNVHRISHAEKIRRQIGFMPDYFGLYSDMTPEEYLNFFGATYGLPEAQRRSLVDDILTLTNLSHKRTTLISGLSRGMQQKLSLGRCLVHSPDLLLLDEPASGLDPRARVELLELLRELQRMGKTIFISSHILTELQGLCDHVAIIDQGHEIFNGPMDGAALELSGGRHFVEVELSEVEDHHEELVASLPNIIGVRRQDQHLVVEVPDTLNSTDLLRDLIRADLPVTEFKRGDASLEEIFMQLTADRED